MKKSILLHLLLPLLVTAFLAACSKEPTPWVPDSGEEGSYLPGEYQLPLIETTDLHGYIVSASNGALHYRMAFIADKVNDIRGRGDDYDKSRLLLLDGGDIYQGASISNLLGGKPVYVAMDRMGYDAVTVGNHEFDWGIDNLVDADATMPDYTWEGQECVNEVPIVCANLYRNGSRVSTTKDYVIVEKTATNAKGAGIPVRIGIIGFAVDYASSIMTSKFTGMGYSINEDYTIAGRIAAELESSGLCDATVLLIHGAADRAAEKLGPSSAIDLVLGGHSHQSLSGTAGTGIPYLQGGRYGEHFARANLSFSVKEKNGGITFSGVTWPNIVLVDSVRDRRTSPGQNANDLEEDIIAVSDRALAETEEQTSSVLGYITTGVTTYSISGSGGRSCTMANWMCDILRRVGEADVAFVNGGGVRTQFPLEGQSRRNITVANIYEMFPFNNLTYVYKLTYEELLRVLEYSVTSAGESLFTSMTGIDCYFSNYAVSSLRKDGTVIYEKKRWTGDWASRTVTLAVSEYLATNQRVDSYTGLTNPLLEWNETPRLLFNELVDNENAILVLREEAAASGGLLSIDTATHYIAI